MWRVSSHRVLGLYNFRIVNFRIRNHSDEEWSLVGQSFFLLPLDQIEYFVGYLLKLYNTIFIEFIVNKFLNYKNQSLELLERSLRGRTTQIMWKWYYWEPLATDTCGYASPVSFSVIIVIGFHYFMILWPFSVIFRQFVPSQNITIFYYTFILFLYNLMKRKPFHFRADYIRCANYCGSILLKRMRLFQSKINALDYALDSCNMSTLVLYFFLHLLQFSKFYLSSFMINGYFVLH